MEKTLQELRALTNYRKSRGCTKKFLAVGLSARKNLCIHPDSQAWRGNDRVDAECRRKTASWSRAEFKGKDCEAEQLCSFYQKLQETGGLGIGEGVFSLGDLAERGRKQGICPYYLARRAISSANIIVFNYLYLLDPAISDNFIKNLADGSVVVFDQAHNIDDVCIECYSVKINKGLLANARRQLEDISAKSKLAEQNRTQQLEVQYNKMLQELRKTHRLQKQPPKMQAKPLKSRQILRVVKDLIQFLRTCLGERADKMMDMSMFLQDLAAKKGVDQGLLRQVSTRLMFLLSQIKEVGDQYTALKKITFFSFIAGQFSKGFKVILQPNPYDGAVSDPLLTLACLDSSLAMQPVVTKFRWVILTSGTMSPIQLYPRLLGFEPGVIRSIDIQLDRTSIVPVVVSASSDQTPLTSEYKSRNQQQITRSYGQLLIQLCQTVPDGIICFFPSYNYMQHIVRGWADLGIIEQLQQLKYLFVEKKDTALTALYMRQFRKACDVGRGAVFLSIARGKIAEGVDFQQHYGRCVVIMGFPVQNSQDPIVQERIRFMIEGKQVKDKNQFFQFDTMRQVAQCLGRVFRGKLDYGFMVLADSRFKKHSRHSKLPKWIRTFLLQSHIDITTNDCITMASRFFRQMGRLYQPSRSLYKQQDDFP